MGILESIFGRKEDYGAEETDEEEIKDTEVEEIEDDEEEEDYVVCENEEKWIKEIKAMSDRQLMELIAFNQITDLESEFDEDAADGIIKKIREVK